MFEKHGTVDISCRLEKMEGGIIYDEYRTGGYGMAGIDTDDIEEIIVTLELEDDGEVECEIICIFEYGDSDYAALTPTDESVEELYFFGIQMDEQGDDVEITLENIEDDGLLEELAAAFDQIMNEDDDSPLDELEAMLPEKEEEEEDDEDDDSRWDEFITKKLD